MATKRTTKTTPAPTTQARRFTTGYVGKSGDQGYAYQVEGNLVRPGELRQTKKNTPYTANSMGIGGNIWRLLAMAEGTHTKDATYPEDTSASFLNIIAYDAVAEALADLPKGARILVSGPISKRTIKDAEKGDRTLVQVVVESFAVVGNKTHAEVIPGTAGAATNVYTGNDGEEHKQNIATLVSGKVFDAKEPGVTGNGRPYFNFSVFAQEPAQKVLDRANGKATDGEYDEKMKLINVSVFGKQAESLAKLVKKGMTVSISGSIDEEVFEGKTYIRMNLGALNVLKFPDPENEVPEDSGDAPVNGTGAFDSIPDDDDDDDELPL